jgi:hypothetical protein
MLIGVNGDVYSYRVVLTDVYQMPSILETGRMDARGAGTAIPV